MLIVVLSALGEGAMDKQANDSAADWATTAQPVSCTMPGQSG